MLNEMNVDRTIADSKGWIPLMYADFAGNRDMVLALLRVHLGAQLEAMHVVMNDHGSRPKVIGVLKTLATVPPFYDALNAYIANHLTLLDGALAFLMRRTTIVNFANRRDWLRLKLDEITRGIDRNRFFGHARSGVIRGFTAKHSDPWNSFTRWVWRYGVEAVKRSPLCYHLRFVGQPAGGPGVERELMDVLASAVTGARTESNLAGWEPESDDGDVDEDGFERLERDEDDDDDARSAGGGSTDLGIALLRPTSDGLAIYHPPPLPSPLPRRLEDEYTALGWLLGYAILHESPLPVAFSSAFLKALAGRADAAGWEDVEEMAPQTARGYENVRAMTDGVDALALTFSVEEEEITVPEPEPGGVFGGAAGTRMIETELVPGGKMKPVTDANVEEYLRLRVAHDVRRVTRSAAVKCVRAAMNDVVPAEYVRMFTAPELACLMGGTAKIDVDEWRANTIYEGGYDADSPQVRWLWRLVGKFTPEERTLLLKFVTGSSRMPAGGFAQLQGMNGVRLFEVMRVAAGWTEGGGGGGGGGGSYALPTASTCFNTLRLPAYPSYDVLEQQVTTALRHGVEGFAFD